MTLLQAIVAAGLAVCPITRGHRSGSRHSRYPSEARMGRRKQEGRRHSSPGRCLFHRLLCVLSVGEWRFEALTAASNQVAGAGEQVGIELTKFAALVCESACLRRTSCPLFGSLSQMFIILYNPQHRFLGLRVGQ